MQSILVHKNYLFQQRMHGTKLFLLLPTSHLPPVLPNARHRPMPPNNGPIHQLIDRRLAGTPVPQIDPGWGLTLSRDRILYRTVDPNGPPGQYILEAVPPLHIPDMTIDLRRYQRILYDSLRR